MASQEFTGFGSHEIIFDFILQKKSGWLLFLPGGRKLYFEDGNLVFASSETSGEHFSDILVTMGVLDGETLAEVRSSLPTGESLGRRLKELGLASPPQLAQALKQQITTVVDRVFTMEEGRLESNDGGLPGRVPKLKIQVLALIMRTISGMNEPGFLDLVDPTDQVHTADDFEQLMETVPLPANYEPLLKLLREPDPMSANDLSDELGWENHLINGLVYVLRVMGAVTLSPPKEVQEELFQDGPVQDTRPGVASAAAGVAGAGLAASALVADDGEEELLNSDENLLDNDEDLLNNDEDLLNNDEDLLGVESEGLDEEDALDMTVGVDEDNPLELSMADGPALADINVADEEDDLDGSLENLDASMPDDDALSDTDLSEDFDEQFDGFDDEDSPSSGPATDVLAAALSDDDEVDDGGPPTDMLASALDDTLDGEDGDEALPADVDEDNEFSDQEDLLDPEVAEDNDALGDSGAMPAFHDEADEAELDDDGDNPFLADDDEDLDNPFADDHDDDSLLGDDEHDSSLMGEDLSLDALDEAAESATSDDLGLDAMDAAARELEAEGYGVEDDAETVITPFAAESDDFSLEDPEVNDQDATFVADDAPDEYAAADLSSAEEAFEADPPAEDFETAKMPVVPEPGPVADPGFVFDRQDEFDESDEAIEEDTILPSPEDESASGLYQSEHKSRAPLFIGMVVLLAVILGGAWFFLNRPSGGGGDLNTAQNRTAQTPLPDPAVKNSLHNDQAAPEGLNPGEAQGANGADDATNEPPADAGEGTNDAAAVDNTLSDPSSDRDGEPPSTDNPEVSQAGVQPQVQPKANKPRTRNVAETAAEPGADPMAEPFAGDVDGFAADSLARFKAQNQPYSLALMLACEKETVQRFLSSNRHDDIYVFTRDYEGRSCYTICYGSFGSSREASQARDAGMPPHLKRYEGAWVKNFKRFL